MQQPQGTLIIKLSEEVVMSKRKKKIIWLTLLTTLAAGGIFWWQVGAKAKVEAPVQTVKASRGNLTLSVSANGTVEPEYTVEIKSKASGVVEKVLVQAGQPVKAGDLLVQINPIVEKRRVNQALATLRIARARASSSWYKLKFTRAQLKRDRKLLKKGLVSREAVAVLEKEAAVQAGDNRVSAAQIGKDKESLREARDRLAETKIKAPIDGIILERLVQPGQIVASGTNSVSGGTTLLKIADLSRLFVRVKVDEADVAKLTPKMAVRITADAMPGKTFGGRVLRVSPQGSIESNVTVFQVIVEVDEQGSKALKPMMSANIEIIIDERREVVLLPQKALRKSRRGKGHFVRLADGGFRKVQAGLSMAGKTEILSGLEAGESVRLPARRRSKKLNRSNSRKQRSKMRGMRRMMGGRR